MINEWPILYKNILKVKNPLCPVAVCTMWTERETVARILKNTDYCVIGNLYGQAGISAMIRNVFANPVISKIILWGADLSGSGQSLVSFMQKGVDNHWTILDDEKQGHIEKEIDKDSLNLFRKKVEIINLRGKSPADLLEILNKLNKKALPFTKAKMFSSVTPTPFTFPSEQSGFRVSAKTVAQTWLKVLNNITRYGRCKTTRYTSTNELKEILNLTAVITDENIDNIYFPPYLPFTKEDLEKYYPQVLTNKPMPGIAYTYGQRLRDNRGVDQIQKIIDLIKTRPFSKKMAAFTADVSFDWSHVNDGDTPCLTQVLGSIQDGKFYFTCHFRSQDMVHGWPRNAFSLRKLQKLICEQANINTGPLTMITHSAHIYSDDYALVDRLLKDNYIKELGYNPVAHFEYDPRGNIVVEVDGKEIVARLFAPNGGLLLKEWRGGKAYEVYCQITDWDYLVLPSHLVYLGTELQRAEFAIEQKREYHQDPAAGEQLTRMKCASENSPPSLKLRRASK